MENTISLNENYLFLRLYRTGKSVVTPHLVVYVKKNRLKTIRLGITASKKIGKAVARNRARRVIREAYRLCEKSVPKGMDVVIVARAKATAAPMQAVQKSLQSALMRLRQDGKQERNG
jgi:ribonuclease P protein component